MINFLKRFIKKIFNLMGLNIVRLSKDPRGEFLSYGSRRHNQRRQEHLASLGLDINGATVLEVGAGIGEHTSFFIDRGCHVVSSEVRPENLKILRLRYPDIRVLDLDLDNSPMLNESFDIVYCYGTLYHLRNPEKAIEFLSGCCKKMLLLDTCVTFGNEDALYYCPEDATNPSQSISGIGCRPTRRWVYNQLKKYFRFIYLPITQPNTAEFPIDWTLSPPDRQALTRAIFIASREEIVNKLLTEEIPMKQMRH
jgi:hypothetical protein